LVVDDKFFSGIRIVDRKADSYEAYANCPVMVIDPRPIYGEAANVMDGISHRFS
jgi:hypothetical protein